MVSTVRLFFDASYAIAIMTFVGIASGFATAAVTGDTERSLQVALAAFALTGALLTVRLWRVTHRSAAPPVKVVPPEVHD